MKFVAVQLVGGASRGRVRHALRSDEVRDAARGAARSLCDRPARLVDGPDADLNFDQVAPENQCARCRAEVTLRMVEESGEIDTTAPPEGMFS